MSFKILLVALRAGNVRKANTRRLLKLFCAPRVPRVNLVTSVSVLLSQRIARLVAWIITVMVLPLHRVKAAARAQRERCVHFAPEVMPETVCSALLVSSRTAEIAHHVRQTHIKTFLGNRVVRFVVRAARVRGRAVVVPARGSVTYAALVSSRMGPRANLA